MEKVFSIKTMSRDELDLAFEWAAREGWNPGSHDAQTFYDTDPKGFFIGYLDDQPIATISAVKYDDKFAFMGFYIVHPDYRGQGYGMKMWEHATKYLGGTTTGLDGVLEQQANYTKSGFKLAHNTATYTGKGKGYDYEDSYLAEVKEVEFKKLASYDARHFPTSRPEFLNAWINLPKSKGFAYIENGRILGYGMIRKSLSGYKIGPLFAGNYSIAENLFKALISSIPIDSDFQIDIPTSNTATKKLVGEFGLNFQFELGRMYKGTAPILPLENIFGSTTYELG